MNNLVSPIPILQFDVVNGDMNDDVVKIDMDVI